MVRKFSVYYTIILTVKLTVNCFLLSFTDIYFESENMLTQPKRVHDIENFLDNDNVEVKCGGDSRNECHIIFF